MTSDPRPNCRDPLLVWLICSSLFLSVGYTHITLSTNDASRYSLTTAIVTRGTLEIGETLELFRDQAGAGDRAVFQGRTYSDKAPLGSFLGVVPAAIAHALFAEHQVYWRIFATSVFVAAIPLALTGGLVYLLALRQGARRERALAVAAGVVFGTNLLYWSTLMFSHALSTCLLVSSFYLVQRDGRRRSQLLAGIAAGLAVASDYYLILLLPVFFFAGSVGRYRGRAWPFVLGAALAGAVPALYHCAIFGSPFVLPYRYQATFGEMHAQGVYGMVFPSLKALWDVTLSSTYGLFFYNPFLLATVLCLPALYRRSKHDFWLVSLSAVVLLLAIASIRDPSYGLGQSWGPRYLMPLVPLLALPLAAARGDGVKWRVTCALLAVSIGINFLILNLYVVPPRWRALHYMLGDGLESLAAYGGFHLITMWCLAVKGDPLGAGGAGAVSALFLALPAATLVFLLRRTRSTGPAGELVAGMESRGGVEGLNLPAVREPPPVGCTPRAAALSPAGARTRDPSDR